MGEDNNFTYATNNISTNMAYISNGTVWSAINDYGYYNSSAELGAINGRIYSLESEISSLKIKTYMLENLNKCIVGFEKTDSRGELPSIKNREVPIVDLSCIGFDYDANEDVYIYHTGVKMSLSLDKHTAFMALMLKPDGCNKSFILNDKFIIRPNHADLDKEITVVYKNHESIKHQRMMASLSNRISKLEKGGGYIDGMDDEWWHKYALSKAPFNVGDTICSLAITNFAETFIEDKKTSNRNDSGLLSNFKREKTYG